jgi:hypothetical protein
MIEKLPTLKEPRMAEVIEVIREGMPELRDVGPLSLTSDRYGKRVTDSSAFATEYHRH